VDEERDSVFVEYSERLTWPTVDQVVDFLHHPGRLGWIN
jgi:hypothetical protein